MEVRITNDLFSNRQNVAAGTSLECQWEKLNTPKWFGNFRKVLGQVPGKHEGRYFNDSDIYKWLEAVAYGLKFGLSQSVTNAANEAIEAIQQCQEPDGYINTFFQLNHHDLKWRNTMMMHEMYCVGHLIEAGVAWFEETGGNDRRLFDVALKAAECVASHFGPEKRKAFPGHEGLELALFRLADASRDQRWSDLAGWMIELRGQRPSPHSDQFADLEAAALSPWASGLLDKHGVYSGEYLQDHLPIREHTDVVGHAVRAMYYYIGAAEWAMRREDQALGNVLIGIWNRLITKRMYITGGIGPSGDNEGFTSDYDLPNLTAYAETCAACALFWWSSRMVRLSDDAYGIETMERVLINNILAGISLDGKKYFYDNPLESRGGHDRTEWFSCACCPPNVARLLLSLNRYVARLTEDGIAIDLPIDCEIDAEINGVKVHIVVESDYPWSGKTTVRIKTERPVHFTVRLPWPTGSKSAEITTARSFESGLNDQRWFWVSGEWFGDAEFSIEFVREPVWMSSHPQVLDNLGRVALTYGPVVYCCEAADMPDFDAAEFYPAVPQHLHVDSTSELEAFDDLMPFVVKCFLVQAEVELPGLRANAARAVPRLLDDIPIEGEADEEEAGDESDISDDEPGDDDDGLYFPYFAANSPVQSVRFNPYFLWNNRGKTHMLVWMRVFEPGYEDYPSLN